ncbi:MAG: hypothetical protein NZ694_05065 [Tepidimonas sp.]|nr:hypothetical protein [Tepidimonas sp.]
MPLTAADSPDDRRATRARWARRLVWALALGLALAVLSWYRSPSFMLHLADRLWSCW